MKTILVLIAVAVVAVVGLYIAQLAESVMVLAQAVVYGTLGYIMNLTQYASYTSYALYIIVALVILVIIVLVFDMVHESAVEPEEGEAWW